MQVEIQHYPSPTVHQQHTIKQQKSLGALKLNYIIYFYVAIVLLAPAYTYHMAVSQKQEPPFPHATITNTACHYPQAQVFRWATTSAGCFLTFIFHIVFRWFEIQAKKYEYPGKSYSYMYWPTILSVFGYLAAICTIDTGGIGTFHIVGAVYYFIIFFCMVTNFTIIAKKMRRWDTRSMSRLSLLAKVIVSGYLSLVWICCLIGLVFEGVSNDNDKYIVIAEWSLWYGGLIWILCFVEDFKNVYITLCPKTMTIGVNEYEQDKNSD